MPFGVLSVVEGIRPVRGISVGIHISPRAKSRVLGEELTQYTSLLMKRADAPSAGVPPILWCSMARLDSGNDTPSFNVDAIDPPLFQSFMITLKASCVWSGHIAVLSFLSVRGEKSA